MEDSITWSTSPLFLLCTLLSLVASLLFLLHRAHGRKNSTPAGKGQLPPGPPALVFLAKFLALRRSIFDLGPLLLEQHARYGPVISVRLFRTLVFIADRRLAHRVLVQGGATFADRPPLVEPGCLFTAGARDISTSPYGPYWRLVRRNLAAEALHPARVSLYAPARRAARDVLVADLLRARGDGSNAVQVRPLFRRALFGLLVHMSLGARLGAEVLDEVQDIQLQILRSITSFPIFSFFPAITKKLFRKPWEAYVAVRTPGGRPLPCLAPAASPPPYRLRLRSPLRLRLRHTASPAPAASPPPPRPPAAAARGERERERAGGVKKKRAASAVRGRRRRRGGGEGVQA